MSEYEYDSRRRLNFGHFVDRIFWVVLTSAAVYASSQIKNLSDSVAQLNVTMATVVAQLSYETKRVDHIEGRVDRLEVK